MLSILTGGNGDEEIFINAVNALSLREGSLGELKKMSAQDALPVDLRGAYQSSGY